MAEQVHYVSAFLTLFVFNTQYIDTNINIDLNGNSYRFELSDTDLNLRPIVQYRPVKKGEGCLSGCRRKYRPRLYRWSCCSGGVVEQ